MKNSDVEKLMDECSDLQSSLSSGAIVINAPYGHKTFFVQLLGCIHARMSIYLSQGRYPESISELELAKKLIESMRHK